MSFFEPIPGETPIGSISELRIEGIQFRSQLNRAEASNIAKAEAKYLMGRLTRRKAPFTYAWMCKLHREMFNDVWGWAGRIRTSVTNIGVAPRFIESRLFDLAQNLPCWKDQPFLEQAALLHHKAVEIHPFENGNGRWSRMLANVWLYRHGHFLTDWPVAEISLEASPVRREYLEAVQAADNGDYDALFALHSRFTPTDADR